MTAGGFWRALVRARLRGWFYVLLPLAGFCAGLAVARERNPPPPRPASAAVLRARPLTILGIAPARPAPPLRSTPRPLAPVTLGLRRHQNPTGGVSVIRSPARRGRSAQPTR